MRILLLTLFVIGTAGLLVELVLLEHYEDIWQLIPMVLLAAGLVLVAWYAFRPSPASQQAFRGLMLAYLASGIVGVFLHYQVNTEFELERDGGLRGLGLFTEAIYGATPTLAPGAMVQLGLLGLVATIGRLRRRDSVTD